MGFSVGEFTLMARHQRKRTNLIKGIFSLLLLQWATMPILSAQPREINRGVRPPPSGITADNPMLPLPLLVNYFVPRILRLNPRLASEVALLIVETNYKYAAKYKVDIRLLFAIQQRESSYQPHAQSNAGAIGLCQITFAFGKIIANKYQIALPHRRNLWNIPKNIEIASAILRHLDLKYQYIKDPRLRYRVVLADYNGGHHQARRLQNRQKLYSETRLYVKKILSVIRQYDIYFASLNAVLDPIIF